MEEKKGSKLSSGTFQSPPEEKKLDEKHDPIEALSTIMIDNSHKLTNVCSTHYKTIGGAHNHYVIKSKTGTVLGSLKFQDGEPKETGVNGIMNEDLLAVLIDRLKGFQSGPFSCKENEVALSKVQSALVMLKDRTKKLEGVVKK